MILRTDDFKRALAGLTSARLTQSAVGESTLELDFAGHVATLREDAGAWLEYDEPVTVMHCGRPLFHGKVTAYERSASASGKSTRVTVSDVWSIFERASLAAQIAEIEEGIKATEKDVSFEDWAQANGYGDLLGSEPKGGYEWQQHQQRWGVAYAEYGEAMFRAAQAALTSWEELARSFAMAAPGWAVAPDGTPLQEATLVMDCTRANYSTAGRWTRSGVVSPWQALQRMRESNPDCFYLTRPDGVLEVVSLSAAEVLTLESGPGRKIIEVEGIAPRFAETWAGVAVILTTGGSGENGKTGSVLTRVWPEGVSLEDTNVKVLTGSGWEAGFDMMFKQAKAWWEATNILQYDGTVRVAMSMLTESPLGKKLNLAGASMAREWGSMEAIIGGVEWEFVSGVVTMTLGVSVEDPQLAELEEPQKDTPGTESERSSSSSEEESSEKKQGSKWRRSSSSSSETWNWEWPEKSSEESSYSSDCGHEECCHHYTDTDTDTDCGRQTDCGHEECCHHSECGRSSSENSSECCPCCKGLAERVAALEKWKEEVMAWARHVEGYHCDHGANEWTQWVGLTGDVQPQSLIAAAARELKVTME